MGFFEFIFKKEKSLLDKEREEREKIRAILETKLNEYNFSKMEKKEVFDVVEIAEANIRNLKDTLIGVDKNDPASEHIVKRVSEEIAEIQKEMSENIKLKVKEIRIRKENYKKELE